MLFSYNSMSQQPNLATEEIRLAIIEALRDPKRRFFSRSDHASRNYLDLWGLTEDNVYQAMIASLEMHELQEKPKQDARDKLKYQHLLYYPEFEDMPEILIYVKLNPLGEPVRVKLSVHPHNTGHQPISTIPIQPTTDNEH